MRNLLILLLWTLPLTLWAVNSPTPSQALYQIELVVFSNFTATGLTQEHWPLLTPFSLPNNAIELNNPAAPNPYIINNSDSGAMKVYSNNTYTILPLATMQLKHAASRLTQQAGFQILLQEAWQQPLNSTPQTVHIFGGDLYNSDGSMAANAGIVSSDMAWQVNGTMTISLQNYINAHFDLHFAEPASTLTELTPDIDFSNIQNGLARFHLLQSRRTRFDEVNYIDFPVYGVLFEVNKVTNPPSAS